MLTSIAEGDELTIDPSRDEARGDDYPITASEQLSDIFFVDLLAIDRCYAELAPALGGGLVQGADYGSRTRMERALLSP